MPKTHKLHRRTKDFDKQAALDQSTGLVWELMPGDTDDDGDVVDDDTLEWGGADGAARYCSNLVLNGKMGFKLPSLHQLMAVASGSIVEHFHSALICPKTAFDLTKPIACLRL